VLKCGQGLEAETARHLHKYRVLSAIAGLSCYKSQHTGSLHIGRELIVKWK